MITFLIDLGVPILRTIVGRMNKRADIAISLKRVIGNTRVHFYFGICAKSVASKLRKKGRNLNNDTAYGDTPDSWFDSYS